MTTQRCAFCGRDAHYTVKDCPLCLNCAENAVHGVIRILSPEEVAQRQAKARRTRTKQLTSFAQLVAGEPALRELFGANHPQHEEETQ